MTETTLAQAVEQYARATLATPDADLDRPWAWNAYDSEGVRFSFFRTYEELRELAARAAAERAARGPAATTAQRILAQYHLAYRDLQAVLLGVTDAQATCQPAEGEWSIRTVVAHIVEAAVGFHVLVTYALERRRGGDGRAPEIPEEAWVRIMRMDEAAYDAVMSGSLTSLLAYYDALHTRVLRELSSITEDEIEAPSMYWEGYELPLRFRLHRFDSHMRQHTIQAEKTLVLLGQGPNEARRLLRLLYAALAEAEGAAIGAGEGATAGWDAAARAIAERAAEVAEILG